MDSVRAIVSRLFKELCRAGLEKLGREQIELVDVPALKKFGSR